MAFAGIVANSLGQVNKELGQKTDNTIKGTFACDNVSSSLLMAAPTACLTIMFIFSSRVFGPGLITCEQYTPAHMHTHSSDMSKCDYYRMADHDFITKYCYGNMADYSVAENGTILTDENGEMEKIKLNYMKLFSYVLLCLAGLGGVPKLYWLLTESKRAARVGYMIDGVEEAMAELIAALKGIGLAEFNKLKEQDGVNKKSVLKQKASRRTKGATERRTSVRASQSSKVSALSTIDDVENQSNYETSFDQNLTECEKADTLREMLSKLWNKDHIRQKFTEFEQVAKARAASRELVFIIMFGRVMSLALNIVLALLVGNWYVWDHYHHDHKAFNCLLPRSYWYYDDNDVEWKTTRCFILSAGAFNLNCKFLFVVYCLLFILQIVLWYRNIRNCAYEFAMIRYLPLSTDLLLEKHMLTDLHIIMGLISENNTSRLTIQAGDKILGGLVEDEHFKILPVLMESIIWSATDVKIDDIVKRMLNRSNPASEKKST